MKRRLLSIVLAVITLLGVVPAAVYAEVIEKFEDDQHWTIVKFDNNSTGENIYEGFVQNTDVKISDSSVTKPFDSDTFLLMEKSEIFTYISSDWNVSNIQISDNFSVKNVDDRNTFDSGWTYSIDKTDIANVNDLCYATGVAFDPTGCGRKNYIAILGYHNDQETETTINSAAYLYIFNGDTGKLVETKELDMSYFYWMYDVYGKLDLDNVDAGNFFQITAGDYNGDGRDSLVFYHGYVTQDCAMYQYDYNVESKKWSLTPIGLYSGYLNAGWYADGSNGSIAGAFWSYNANGNMHKNLNVCLESGDINGDGIDDLVVVSNTGGLSKSEANGNIAQVATTVTVGFGKKGAASIADLKLSGQKTIYDNSTKYTLSAPGVSIGDIDGDGNNEVVVAGFINKPSKDDPNQVQNDAVGFTYFEHKYYTSGGDTIEQTNGLQVLKGSNISPISKGDSLRTSSTGHEETLYQQFSVECVNFDGSDSNGKKTKDYIFLNGYVYQLNDNNNPVKKSVVTTDTGRELFGSCTTQICDRKGNDFDIDEVFIFSAAVGNFTGSANGAESLSLTVGFHVNYSKSSDADGNAYYLGEVTITKTSDGLQGILSYNMPLALCSNATYDGFTSEGVWTSQSASRKGGFCGMSFIRVACDVGTDSIFGQYVTTEAFYSDPEVVAVLQAAPYFKELEAGNSSTIYSYSETYGNSSSTGYDFTLGFGVCAEIETNHFKMEVEETIKSSLSEEFEKSLETTYTTEFEANDLNQVILRRKLYYNYIYTIKTYDGKLPDGLTDENDGYICFTVLRNPSVTALTFSQYDAYARWYNQEMQKVGNTDRLNTISNTNLDHYHMLNNEGNPGGYASDLSAYGSKGFSMVKDGTWVELSSASGTISQKFDSAVGTAYTQTTSKGVDVNIKVMGGASFAGNGAFAGVQASMEYFSSESTTTSTVKTTSTSGTVQGIASDLEDYSFQWQLIGWRASDNYPMFNNSNVLFVGYLVSDVKSLPQPVSDLKESYSPETDTVTLTWTSPTIGDGRPEISDFYIYQDGTRIGVVDNSGEGKTHTFTTDVSENNTASSTFYIVSHVNETGKKSLESNVVTSILALTKKQTTALVQEMLDGLQLQTDTLEAAIAEKASSADLAAAIAALTEAYKEADALLDQNLDAAESEIEALKAALDSASAVLQGSIDALQANLDSAVADLNAALAAGDQANAEALNDATNALTGAYEAADALLKSGIDGEITALEAAMDAAQEALGQAVDKVQSNLDSAVADLNAALAAGDQANSDALTDATNTLTGAYEAADALLKSGVDGEIADLKAAMEAANKALQQTIDQFQPALDSAIAKLNAALAAGDKENAEAIAQAISDMNQQISKAYDLLVEKNETLQKELDDAQTHFNSEIESLRAELSELGIQLSTQKTQHDADIQNVRETGEQMEDSQRSIVIIGLGISIVSLLGNIGLVTWGLLRKKNPFA